MRLKNPAAITTARTQFYLKTLASLCIVSSVLAGCTTSTEQADSNQTEAERLHVVMVDSKAAQAQPQHTDQKNTSLAMADVMMESGAESVVGQRVAKVQAFAAIKRPIFVAPAPAINTENYADLDENAVKITAEQPVSTFSVDVDTASYSNVRRMLNQGVTVPAAAVRSEEFINYFDYDYPLPEASQPFSLHTDVVVSPWNEKRHLMRVALKGFEVEKAALPGANLVFLLDVSGSMNSPSKLPLLKQSLKMLSSQLSERDSVSIVVYAGASGVVLEPTAGNDYHTIAHALEQLQAGGSTNGASGISLAYSMAQKAFIKGGINRVLLATDGDFNVGLTDHKQLIDLIERKREMGIALSVLGFGQGNYNDHLTEQLADAGNGNAAYIDNINEARKVLVDEMQSTLQIIAKDVKIQLEFNPNTVAEYRLIGYENRHLNKEDFNNDKVDAGEIGAGHTVTAFYEIALKGSGGEQVDELRYQTADTVDTSLNQKELGFLKVRYKNPDSDSSNLLTQPILTQDIIPYEQADNDFKFATSVVGFASLLKRSQYTQDIDADWLIENAVKSKGIDEFGYRAEFTQLMRNYNVIGGGIISGDIGKASSGDEPETLVTLNNRVKTAVLVPHSNANK